nr:apoptosis-enhancing nuclease [Misgurnus anguillicaudatus]
MSALPWRHLLISPVEDQNISERTNKKTTMISQQANGRKRRKKSKRKSHAMETPCEQRGKKRKLNDILENKEQCARPSDVLNSLLEQGNDLQIKRPKNNPQRTEEAKSALFLNDSWEVDSGFSSGISPSTSGRSSPCVGIDHLNIIAMDCEMVGTGPGGKCSEVARCSIVDYYGRVIYDKYILPQHPVTNYRTRWSGIRKHHLAQALPFEDARNEILDIMKGKIIIGHSLYNDLKVLDISIPTHMVRDTCSCSLLNELFDACDGCNISLKKLAEKLLSRTIQVGRMGHCSVEDARATLDLYKLVEDQWEKDLSQDSIDHTSNPNDSLEHYMQDQYWPESVMDCSI